MKILYVTDTHIRGTSPRSRLDDYPAAMRAKLGEVVDLARACGAAAILHGGDLFDRPDVAPAVALEFLRVLKGAPCPIIGIAGNHDVFGFNPETVPRTMLGLFAGFGICRLLRPGEVAWLEADGLRVQVTGQEFHAEIDRRNPVLDYCVRQGAPASAGDPAPAAPADLPLHVRHPGADFAIHLTHGMLLEQPFLDTIAHSLLSQVMPHTVADVTFGGHYHPGWSRVHEHEGRLFINPGALARLGNQRSDLTRPVQAVLLDLARGQPVRCRFLPLAAAPPAEQVLDRSRDDARFDRERALAEFIQGVGDVGQFEVLAVQQIMERIAEAGGVDERVRREALTRLGAAQEALGRGEDEPA